MLVPSPGVIEQQRSTYLENEVFSTPTYRRVFSHRRSATHDTTLHVITPLTFQSVNYILIFTSLRIIAFDPLP